MATETRYYDCTPASTSGLGDWVQIEIANPPVLPVGDGAIVVTHVASGHVLPHKVLAKTASRLRFTVALHSPTNVATVQRIRVDISDAGTAHPGWFDWASGDHSGGASVGPTIVIEDGLGATYNGGTPTDSWVHPAALKVPAGSWMRFKDATERDAAVGTVTHVRIDTPYPGEQWENPHLLYSTDDGATWAEWSASINPLAPYPGGGGWNSDVGFIVHTDGSLHCFWRGGDFGLDKRVVTGTCLADAIAAAKVDCTVAEAIIAPSFVAYGGTWYMFYTDANHVRRQQSTNLGLTWTTPVTAIASTVTNGDWVAGGAWDPARRYWHGSAVGPFADGRYYAAFSENPPGNANSGYAAIRLFRASNPTGEWEACRQVTLRAAQGLGAGTWYQACPFERVGGSLAVIASGLNGSDYRVTTQTLTAGPVAITEAEAFQFDTDAEELWRVTSSYGTDNTTRGTVTDVFPEPDPPPPGAIEYQLEYRVNGGAVQVLQPWAADRTENLDTTALSNGGWLELRAKARDASTLEETTGAWITTTINNGGAYPTTTYVYFAPQGPGGVPLTGKTITLASTNPAAATVVSPAVEYATGLYRALVTSQGPGAYSITATAEGVNASTPLTVA